MHHETAARLRRTRWVAGAVALGAVVGVAVVSAGRGDRPTALAAEAGPTTIAIGATLPPSVTFGGSPTSTTPAVGGLAEPGVDLGVEPGVDPVADPVRRARLAFVGDVLMHSPLVERAADTARAAGVGGYDFRPMFADVRPLLSSADLAVCHLETPVAPAGERLSTAPLYGVPVEVVDGLAWAGFDHCSTASNHALDRGTAGIDATLGALDRAGITQTGMARSAAEATPIVLDVAGIAIAPLSYTYSFNGLRLPADEPWRSNPIDVWRILSDALVARERGAEVVVVSLHWGTEGRSEPNDDQVALADTLTASGLVDLVVGHHAHVVQPIATVNGRWVAYGLGNIISNLPTSDMWPAAAQDAMVLTVDVSVDATGVTVERPVVHPTWVDKRDGWVIRDVFSSLRDPALPTERRPLFEASLWRTGLVVGEFHADR
jgi:poly-gamma-glutamate synthesis protein (capsule biosynthesis protein)